MNHEPECLFDVDGACCCTQLRAAYSRGYHDAARPLSRRLALREAD